jgi:hypothetical protein
MGVKPQKGGKAELAPAGGKIEQGENPSQPSRIEQHRTIERTYTLPPGSELVSWTSSAPEVPGERQKGQSFPRTNYSSVRVSAPMLIQEREISGGQSELGAAQKDEARSLAAKFSAMKPVQWVGILLCVGSIAAFYFGWPSLGFLAIAVGGGMITVAAVLPGHEMLILGIAGIGFIVVALALVYAYSKGKLDANHNGIPDFLEKLKDVAAKVG